MGLVDDSVDQRYCDCHEEPMSQVRDRTRKRGWRWVCPHRQREATARWIEKHPERRRETSRKSNWKRAGVSITPEEFYSKLEEQGSVCGICSTDDPGSKGWHADHDHTTGKNRGVLCGACNRGLGFFEDSIEGLLKALRYLEQYE